MNEKQGFFRLGLFVVVSLVTLMGILFILGGRSLFQPRLTIETYFDGSVAGLEVGAPVQFRGVPIGKISDIVTSSALYQEDMPVDSRKSYIVVRAELSGNAAQVEKWRREMPDYVRRGMRAQTQLAGVTGQQYIALDFFDPEKNPPLTFDWKPEHPYVPSAPSLTGQIIGNVQDFLASLNEADIRDLGKNLNALLQTLNRKVGAFPIADLSAEAVGLLKKIGATVERVDRVIAEAPIDEAVGNVASVSARLDKLLANPGIEQTVNNAAGLTSHLRTTVESGRIERVVKDLDQTIQRIDSLIGDNQYDVRVIVQDLRTTADNLRTLSESAKQYPAGVLFGGPPNQGELPWKESK